MKHKQVPEDFRVEELTERTADSGPFAFYRLTKRWIGTLEAIAAIRQQWHLPRDRISFGGLKDFHGVTQQYVTIHRGPRRGLQSRRFQLEHLGQTAQPFGPQDVTANRFHVVLRDLDASAVDALTAELAAVARDGVPNYFDDQRFGSVGQSGEFIAHPWCRGDYERVLWLALADPNEHDSPAERDEKRLLREHWGQWALCHPQSKRSHRWRIIRFLAERPADFRGAVAHLRVDLRSLYVAAFQSHLWNGLLALFLRELCRSDQVREVSLRFAPVPVPVGLDPKQTRRLLEAELPLPSARLKPAPGLPEQLLTRLLGEIGLELRQLRVKYPRDTFFSKGFRRAMFQPLVHSTSHKPDERTPGRRKLLLSFDLPRGCYATILLKRLQCGVDRS